MIKDQVFRCVTNFSPRTANSTNSIGIINNISMAFILERRKDRIRMLMEKEMELEEFAIELGSMLSSYCIKQQS